MTFSDRADIHTNLLVYAPSFLRNDDKAIDLKVIKINDLAAELGVGDDEGVLGKGHSEDGTTSCIPTSHSRPFYYYYNGTSHVRDQMASITCLILDGIQVAPEDQKFGARTLCEQSGRLELNVKL